VASPSDNITEAIAAAEQAEVTIVVAATTSGEAEDRRSLHLDGGADALIDALVAKNVSNIVVIMQAPGAVVMPWRNSVAGILLMFLGGQETGSAWADVLFADHVPTGRLPIMLPATEADTIAPSESPSIVYSEGLATSYRNRNASAAFPFGHGLTYATFEVLAPTQVPCGQRQAVVCVEVVVLRNHTGTRDDDRPAGTVAQLYLEMSADAGQPAPFLKGFEHTGLLTPGGNSTVTFGLTERDLSYMMACGEPKPWQPPAAAVAHVGESSEDIRHSLLLDLPDIPAEPIGLRPASDGLPDQEAALRPAAPASQDPDSASTSGANGSSCFLGLAWTCLFALGLRSAVARQA
jgi:beta-glucosidase